MLVAKVVFLRAIFARKIIFVFGHNAHLTDDGETSKGQDLLSHFFSISENRPSTRGVCYWRIPGKEKQDFLQGGHY